MSRCRLSTANKVEWSEWRLLPLLVAPGALHMAIDEWLLDQHRAGEQSPTLRFYQWSPVALSLGYHQRQIPEHWRSLTWQGKPVELVRRPSGGRAVLHQGDLTFAVVTSGLSGDRMQVYQTLCQFLIEGWRSLGVSLQLGQMGRGYIHNPNCFGTATAADLLLPNGSKFIGCAQLKRGDAVLQHGSMRLNPSAELYEQVFGEPMSTSTLPEAIESSATQIDDIITALVKSAEACFGIRLTPSPLTADEWTDICQHNAVSQKVNGLERSRGK